MVKRKIIGLIYNYNENWIGGTYYIENIILALNTLSDQKKPNLIIYTKDEETFNKLQKTTNYSYLKFENTNPKYTLLQRAINKVSRIILSKKVINKRPQTTQCEFIFPNPDEYFFYNIDNKRKIYWIPDFQEVHLPEFFSKQELQQRKQWQIKIANEAQTVVFSSKNAYSDFCKIYPLSNTKKVILPFAVQKKIEKPNKEDITSTKGKYGICHDYFLVPNQLWIHKNHKTVLQAISNLVKDNSTIQVIFTGKEYDYRFPNYPSELKQMVNELGLTKNAKFIGFIPKQDLENLIIAAKAIIQPSLFEGWSTVIEESKQYSKFIIASDTPIHFEQLERYPNKVFFSKNDPIDLTAKIQDILNSQYKVIDYDYKKDIEQFANKFLTFFYA